MTGGPFVRSKRKADVALSSDLGSGGVFDDSRSVEASAFHLQVTHYTCGAAVIEWSSIEGSYFRRFETRSDDCAREHFGAGRLIASFEAEGRFFEIIEMRDYTVMVRVHNLKTGKVLELFEIVPDNPGRGF